MPRIVIDAERCKQCMLCVEFCPVGALEISGTNNNSRGYLPVQRVEGVACTGCGICHLVCPSVCIEVHHDE